MNLNLEKTKLADYSRIYYPTAKKCALIAVDEIISLMIKFHGRHIEDNLTEIEYWEEVKNEINLL